MSKRRMFSSDIINSDRFIEMSLASQAVYFHLAMTADDDGFINSATRTIRAVCGRAENVEELINNDFLIRFQSGILLVRHWNLHNQLKKDRYTPTMYTNEMNQVVQIDKVYYLKSETECIHSGSIMEPQISKEKISLVIDSLGESRDGPPPFTVPSITDLETYAESIGYKNFNAKKFLSYYTANRWTTSNGRTCSDWKALVDVWKAREKDFSPSSVQNNSFKEYLHTDYDIDEIEKLTRKN